MRVEIVGNISKLTDKIFESAKTNISKITFVAAIALGLMGVIIGCLASYYVIVGCKTISSLFITGVLGSSLALIFISWLYKEKF